MAYLGARANHDSRRSPVNQNQSGAREFQLLSACTQVLRNQSHEHAIRQIIANGIDWTIFVRTAIGHGLAALSWHTLDCVAPDMVPDEIRDVLCVHADQAPHRNRVLFQELFRVTEALESNGIEAIACRPSIPMTGAHDELGFGTVEDLHILIDESDFKRGITTLCGLGYQRKKQLTAAQLDIVRQLQGHETLFKIGSQNGVQLYTRLAPKAIALDVDLVGLWRRSKRETFGDRAVTTPSAEDKLIVLAILGSNELWQRASLAREAAAFIRSHPDLDWAAVVERARAQGCLCKLLLATALAHRHFGATVPDSIIAAERDIGKIALLSQRVTTRWHAYANESVALCDEGFSLERLSLHDGVVRGARYAGRSLILPHPHHVARNPFPGLFTSLAAYCCFKIVHDVALYPVLRLFRYLRSRAKRLRDILTGFKIALSILPFSAEERRRLRQHHEVRAHADRALKANPGNAEAWQNLGNALHGLGRHKAAIACYDKALGIEPYNSGNWSMRRAAMVAIGWKTELSDFASDSKDIIDWIVRANALFGMKRFTEASDASDRALCIDPTNMAAKDLGVQARRNACDWRRREKDERWSAQCQTTHPRMFVRPFCKTEAENFVLARQIGKKHQVLTKQLWRGEIFRHDKIRIAYVTEYARLPFPIGAIFENHDRTRFETTAIFVGENSRGGASLCKDAFDRVIEAHAMDDEEAAKILRALEIDIAVDLNGFIGNRSTKILSARPAPVQVNYWGYTGTLGVPFIDYIIADRIVIPEENRIHYSENVVYLPHCYQPNLRNRPITDRTPSRADVGLPETGFVFASFNKSYKITPQVFEIWMRLLHAVENSVLWLLEDNPSISDNLRREAQARGVSPERLIFASRKSPADYLAQQRLADLFLDTMPINAHATASDALCVGLPVLTCTGNTFTSRVATSLLNAIGLPELATTSLCEYEEQARALALDPGRLAILKAKLLRNRDTEPLFDPVHYMRHLESAYSTMWERQQTGAPPIGFSVSC